MNKQVSPQLRALLFINTTTMRNKKPVPKYYMPGLIRVHLKDSKDRQYIVSPGFVTIDEANDAMLGMMERAIDTPVPFLEGWFSQDITPVY